MQSRFGIVVALALAAVVFGGCKKKAEPAQEAAEAAGDQVQETTETTTDTVEQKTEETPAEDATP